MMDNKVIIICLIVAAALILFGGAIFSIVMTINHWDFSCLTTANYLTTTHTVSESFDKISIDTKTSNVHFALSTDGENKVVCKETDKYKFSVKVENGMLNIGIDDNRKWTDCIGIDASSFEITVYLCEKEFSSLFIKASTGDIEILDDFHFESVVINTTTGKITLKNIIANDIKTKVSTGNIKICDVKCNTIEANCTTGDVLFDNFTCDIVLSKGTTGKLDLKNIVASDKIDVQRKTGDILLEKCDAGEISIKTTTGSVKGSLLSEKIFITHTSTGSVKVPQTSSGGKCIVNTSTGSIKFTIE